MKIGIDARLWSQTGVGRYIRNICINLQKLDKKNDYVLFIRSKDKEKIASEIKNENWKLVIANYQWHSLKEQLFFPNLIKKQNLDLMHYTYQRIPVFYHKKFVVTIHDLIPYHFMTGRASTKPIWLYGFLMMIYRIVIHTAARRSLKIITPSNSTKRDIIDNLHVSGSKIEVIYEAPEVFKGAVQNLEKGKYFLYVGAGVPHKNIDTLIRAFKIINDKNDVKLILVGPDDYFYNELEKHNKKLINDKKLIIYKNPDDEILYSLYKNAVSLVMPSFIEGFSLPPLEALSEGTLAIASNIPVHRELYGDSIFYFNPKDKIDLTDKMNYVLNLDEKERERKISAGKKLAEAFSWEKAAKETLKIYLSC